MHDPGTPLRDVTFVVLDLETTGTSAEWCDITEVGALKLRGGECIGTFQTLLATTAHPARRDLPTLDSVLPALLEFVGPAVLIGHNVAFDLRFLQAAAQRLGYPPLANVVVDTYALARRLVLGPGNGNEDDGDTPDCRLATLARHYRTATTPNHRAFDDASATAEVFHAMLEVATGFGVLALDDLLALPVTGMHPDAAKLRLVAPLPRSAGVYVFRDRAGRARCTGYAEDIRCHVRSFFAGEDRRRMTPVLQATHTIDHVPCANALHGHVVQLRLARATRKRRRRDDVLLPSGHVRIELDGDGDGGGGGGGGALIEDGVLVEAWPRLGPAVRTDTPPVHDPLAESAAIAAWLGERADQQVRVYETPAR